MTDEAPITDAARRAPSHDAVVPGVAALVVLTPDVRELRFVAAGYSFLKKGGTGNPEEAGKVLVVTRGTHVGYSVVLERVGPLRPEQQEREHQRPVRRVEDVRAAHLDEVLRGEAERRDPGEQQQVRRPPRVVGGLPHG